MSRPKQRPVGFKLPFDIKWLYGALIPVLIVPILIFGRDRVVRVWAAPDEVDQLKIDAAEQKQQNIQQGAWIAQSIKETDMAKKAYKGTRWEPSIGEYVDWPEDPRLKKK